MEASENYDETVGAAHNSEHIDKKVHFCTNCSFSCRSISSFRKHMKIHPKSHFSCSICKLFLRSFNQYSAHFKSCYGKLNVSHSSSPVEDDNVKSLPVHDPTTDDCENNKSTNPIDAEFNFEVHTVNMIRDLEVIFRNTQTNLDYVVAAKANTPGNNDF
jgi:hypothetical protein